MTGAAPPIKAFIICRDRVTYARTCYTALSAAGLQVHLVDHGSTWWGMLHWLRLREADPNSDTVVHWRPTRHPRSLWSDGFLANYLHPEERFIVTDCDVIPPVGLDWVGALQTALTASPDAVKAGLALRTSDLPEHYPHRRRVLDWERQYQTGPHIFCGGTRVVSASVDTTLALYRRLEPQHRLDPSVRVGWPYEATHLSWYEDPAGLNSEIVHYYEHVPPLVSHWADPTAYLGEATA